MLMHFSLQINWIKIKNLLWNQKTDTGGKREEKRRKKGFEIEIKIETKLIWLICSLHCSVPNKYQKKLS